VVDGITYLIVETPVVVVVIPVVEPPEPVARIVITDGSWEGGYDYLYFETTSEGRFLYRLNPMGKTPFEDPDYVVYDIEYEPNDGKFYDVGTNRPSKYGQDNTGTNILPLPTSSNMPIIYLYNSDDGFSFQFDNPYYVAPPEPVARIVGTGGDWETNYDYLYFETTPEGRYLYGLVHKSTTTKYADDTRDIEYDPIDKKFHDVGGAFPHLWGQDNTGTNILDFPTLSNMETHYWYRLNGG